MNFKYPYLLAMREQAPKMFNQLRRTGALDAYVAAKSKEAHELIDYLTKDAPKIKSGLPEQPYLGRAERAALETLIEFPSEGTRAERPARRSEPLIASMTGCGRFLPFVFSIFA